MGHLTSMGRDEWAASRAALEGFSPVNKATLFEVCRQGEREGDP